MLSTWDWSGKTSYTHSISFNSLETFLTIITTYHFSPETVDINCWHIWKVCSCSVSPGSGQCPESAMWLRLREQSEHLELSKQWWNPKKSPFILVICSSLYEFLWHQIQRTALKKLLVAQLVCQWKQVPTPLICALSAPPWVPHTPRTWAWDALWSLRDAPVVTRSHWVFLNTEDYTNTCVLNLPIFLPPSDWDVFTNSCCV